MEVKAVVAPKSAVAVEAAVEAVVVAEDVATVAAEMVAAAGIRRRHRPAVVVAPSRRASMTENGYTTASNLDS